MAAHAIFKAIETGDAERVRELVDAAGERDDEGVSALLRALYYGSDEMVEALRPGKIELDVFEAAAFGDVDRLRKLLDEDPARVDAFAPDGFTPLTLAAFFRREEAVRLLLERGADANLRAQHAQIQVMPIHAAAAGNETGIVRLLLDSGADVTAEQPGGFTALDAAEQNANAEMAALLRERGAKT